MTDVRVEKQVKDLQLGDVVCGQGVVRSIVPASGGRLYVLLEKTIIDTTTFEPEARVNVCVEWERGE